MPFYPLKKIKALAESSPVYLRGVHGYNAGWARAFAESANPFYPCFLTARAVEEDGRDYAVEVGFDALDELEYFSCDCGQFHPREGACKHIVAVLVYKYYQDMVAQLPTAAALEQQQERTTDPAARQMIDRYMAEETRRLQQTGGTGTVALTPLLVLDAGHPALRFTIGSDRPYLLKNLARFAERMQQGETAEYGKQLTLYHHPDSFSPESRPVLDFLLAGLAAMTDGLALTDREWSNGRITLPRYRALYLDAVLREREGVYLRRDPALRELLSRSRSATENEYPLPESLRSVLRPYQQHGYRWLRTMEELGFGGILADDMGLGKTLQVIALLLAAKESGSDRRPSLVVCPTSLVLSWEREIQRFAPALRALCVVGDAAARQALLEQTAGYDVLLTSYDLLKRDVALYRGLEFHYHILDEAQYIKNSSTQNAKAVKAIRSAQRFALTGTPVENRLSELWSIFDFLMPGLLFRYSRFRERFETPIVRQGDEQALTQLSRMTAPFILRRLKRDVLTELPEKTERLLPATMENAQRQVYRDTIQELRRQLEDSRDGRFSGQSRITALALLTRLRQICCDPRLCCEGYTGESCKLEACVELLKEAAAGGHKVLLFSQFTSMLALIRQRLEEEQIGCYVLQGSTSKEQRAALVDAFNRDDTPVFLISLKAGGTGLNLTGADMVIHYDPWWNLSAQNQATDRAHRIGQKNPVQVVRLVVRDTVEEKILRMQEDKWRLAEAVVTADGPSIASLSAEELLTLLAD